MIRNEIINTLIRKYKYKNYLEIGVFIKDWCFNTIECEKKTSVDPGYENENEIYDYKMESDEFFKRLREGNTEFSKDHKWDIIFIDGLHLAEQVEKDITNSLMHLSPNGTIVMHDCNPPYEFIGRETYRPDYHVIDKWSGIDITDQWTGTTWKAFYKFRHSRPDLSMWCVNDDCGVGIIQFGSQFLAPNDNQYYSYLKLCENKKEYLNLIEPHEFIELFGVTHV